MYSHPSESKDSSQANLLLSGKLKQQDDFDRNYNDSDIGDDVESRIDKPKGQEIHTGALNVLVPEERFWHAEKEGCDDRVDKVASDKTEHDVTC